MTLKNQIMKLQTYKMYEDEVTVYVERDDVLKLLDQQPYEDCISRQELLEELGEEPFNWNDSPEAIQEVRDYQWFRSLVENAPPVTTKQKTGKWKLLGCYRNGHGHVYNCSECGETEFYVSNYCPNCGAKMAESESDD